MTFKLASIRALICIKIAALVVINLGTTQGVFAQDEQHIEIESGGWILKGILNIPEATSHVPAVLLCHMGGSNKEVYDRLAGLLAERGVGSLRLDLRGHGESTNLGVLDLNSEGRSKELLDLLIGAWPDVVEAHKYLEGVESIDAEQIGFVGSSYSAEVVATAGRNYKFGKAYVLISGMPSPVTSHYINALDVPWWIIWSNEGDSSWAPPYMELFATLTSAPQFSAMETGGHGTDLFDSYPNLEVEIADWFAEKLER